VYLIKLPVNTFMLFAYVCECISVKVILLLYCFDSMDSFLCVAQNFL